MNDMQFRSIFRKTVLAGFSLFVLLSLITPSWRYGPFAWLPLIELVELAGAPMALGVFNLLPLLILLGWGGLRLAEGRLHGQWGRLSITLPFLGITLLGFLRLHTLSPRHIFIQAGGLGIAWLVYLMVVSERPSLSFTFSLIVMIQSGTGLAQFFLQRDLGLTLMGELPLNPAFSGVTVLFARETRWLRAYGLTAHPNLLGALLVVMLLFLLVAYGRSRGSRQWRLGFVLAVGYLGLFVSFSRSAWLGFAVGVGIWNFINARNARDERMAGNEKNISAFSALSAVKQLLPTLPLLIMLLLYGDLVLSRVVGLETAVEARSLDERVADSQLALHLIAVHPWTGVGMGNYTDAAQVLEPSAQRVHNVPLLIAAELGLPGLFLWLILVLAPLVMAFRFRPFLPVQIGIWLAMLLMSQFDTMLWVSSNWQTAVLFALIASSMTAAEIV